MKISPHCYAITGLGYVPPWEVNAGVVAGSHTTLVIDTGPSCLAAHTILGYAQAVRPANTVIAINTEPHFDHVGGNSFFCDNGIEIYGHEKINRGDAALHENTAAFADSITDLKRKNDNEASVFFSDTRVVNPTIRFREPFDFDLGAVTARIVLLPGHTYANCGIWVEEERILFSGDCMVTGYRPNLDAEDGEPAWRKWLESLELIQALRPKVILPGHGYVIEERNVVSEIDRMRSFLNERLVMNEY